MKHSIKMLIVAGALALTSLGGCAAIQNAAGNSPVAADAIKGAQVAIATYADIYQPAVIAYGNLPVCPTAALCRDPAVHAKLKAIDKATVTSIEAAQAVLRGNLTDAGQITTAMQAILNAENQIVAAGVVLKR